MRGRGILLLSCLYFEAHILKQALDEMKAFYGEKRRRLAEQLLLFDTFLQRTDTLSIVEKCKVQEYLDMFDSLLDESRFVKQVALARDEAAARELLSM